MNKICEYCNNGKITSTGMEIFAEFQNPAIDRRGNVYRSPLFIFKTNGRYFLESDYFTYEIVACPRCGRALKEQTEQED